MRTADRDVERSRESALQQAARCVYKLVLAVETLVRVTQPELLQCLDESAATTDAKLRCRRLHKENRTAGNALGSQVAPETTVAMRVFLSWFGILMNSPQRWCLQCD